MTPLSPLSAARGAKGFAPRGWPLQESAAGVRPRRSVLAWSGFRRALLVCALLACLWLAVIWAGAVP